MQHYKAPDDSLHCIEPEFAYLLPDGCIAITEEEAEALLPKPSPQAIIEAKKQTVRAMREQVLERLNGIAGRAAWRGNTALAEACYVASEALLDITKDLPSDPNSVELVMFGRYLTIRQAAIEAAPSLATAFAQVDA
jgi:hypothetical protein